ncbi:Beta-barrel assembly machine subunit BamA [Gloeocapsa sp. PCC 7428]|uniref:BamA/TamA family outer membrane protein n=1 Tax=Gloeocapsa sp. PCC 7428 TaxID=1173026 RepID=UPI0002A610D7|nr:BamA/TamA family outer membrane protein [Gloeocapsa sp. PCC 7428]AFZ31056.1 Beta-barrel assembly machine subunit BamA [Gloeocapsa sp. PCC 7428]
MRISPFWAATVAIAAPLSLTVPAAGQTVDPSQIKSGSQPPQMAQEPLPATGVVVETKTEQRQLNSAKLLGQTPVTPTTPQPQPSPVFPSPIQGVPATPPQQPVPVTPPPGAGGAPQDETPSQLQVPITPEAPLDAPPGEESVPAPATPPQPAPLPEGVQPEVAPPLTPQPEAQPEATPDTAPQVLVSEVVVSAETGVLDPELENQVYQAVRTVPGRTTTRTQLQEDINAIFATGFFSNVRAEPTDTPLGVRVTFVVQPNPVLRSVQVQANPGTNVPSVLPAEVVNNIFQPQYGRILNLRQLQAGIQQLNRWYQDNGYVLAQVVAAPQVSADGVVTLEVAEGVVEDIQVRFINEGEATDDEGRPIEGRTRDFIITRELALQPGQVFNRTVVQQDLQRVFGLGLFEDVNVSLNPGQDPRQVVVVVNVDERNSGSIAAGAGFSSASGLFGTLSYQEQNLGGNNQKVGGELQVGQREVLFDLRFTDPWIAGDPFRTSYTVNAFRRRSISLVFDSDDEQFEVINNDGELLGDRPRVLRLGGGVTFTRPLSQNPLARSEWTASAGLEYQRISIRDSDGDLRPQGQVGEDGEPTDLSFSGTGIDDLLTLQVGLVRDRRDNPLRPTNGSLLRFGVEQSVPIGSGSIFLNRLRGSYSQYLPVNFTNFAEGPETLAFNIQAGTVLGDLPPYEAFSLGGVSSVRGFNEGDLGTGRSFVQATAEYRFPIFSVVGGALFVDVASDLGTGENVPGNPAGQLDKPGSGFGYGIGLRVQSPLGPLRIDYGFNSEGENRLHFGIGERF